MGRQPVAFATGCFWFLAAAKLAWMTSETGNNQDGPQGQPTAFPALQGPAASGEGCRRSRNPGRMRDPSSSKTALFEDELLKSFISSSFSPLFEDELAVSPISSSKSAYFEDEFFAARGKRASTVRAGRPVKRAT